MTRAWRLAAGMASLVSVMSASTAGFAQTPVPVAPGPVVDDAADRKARAAQLWRAGRAALERGDHYAAGEAFEQANALVAHGQTALAAGLAWERAGEKARAAEAYESALRVGNLSDEERATVVANLTELRTTLAVVEVALAHASLSVERLQRVRAPARHYVVAGRYTLRHHCFNGAETTRLVQLQPGTLHREPEASECLPRALPVLPVAPLPGGGDTSVPPSSGLKPTHVGGIVTGALALVGVGATIGLGVAAQNKADAWNVARIDLGLRDAAEDLQLATNLALAGTLVLAATSGVLLLVAALDDGDERTADGPADGPAAGPGAGPGAGPASTVSLRVGPTSAWLKLTF